MRPFLNIILIFVSLSVYSQPIFFNRSYVAPETYWTWGKSILPTDNGYVACAIGSGYNGWTNKNIILCFTDIEGTPLDWKHFGEPNYHYYPAGSGSMKHISGTGFALPIGRQQGNCFQAGLFLFNYDGDTIWTKKYLDDESGDSCALIFRNLIQSYNNDFVLCGTQYGPMSNGGDFMILRTDAQGNKKWQKNFGTSAAEEVSSIAESNDNGLILGGFRYTPGLDYSGDAIVIKTDYWGTLEWEKIFGGDFRDIAAKVAIAHDGNFIVGYGHAYYETIPGYPYCVISLLKLDQSGDTIWHVEYGDTLLGNSLDEIIPLSDGNYIALGTTQIEPNVLSRSFLLKFNDNGDSLWYKQYLHSPSIPSNIMNDLSITDDNGFILCGGVNAEVPPNPEQMWIMKVDSNGCDTCGTGVGISQFTDFSGIIIDLFPNPTTSQIQVRFSILDPSTSLRTGSRSSIFIYDLYGRIHDAIIIPKGQTQTSIDVSAYPSGVYVVVLKSEDGNLMRGKFVKR